MPSDDGPFGVGFDLLIGTEDDANKIRTGCCLDWPKPCGYHEGFLDGWDLAAARFDPTESTDNGSGSQS